MGAGGIDQDQNAIGGLVFFDATGNQVTGGSVNSPVAAYIVGQTELRAGDTTAVADIYQPEPGQTPDLWSNFLQIGLAGSTYPASAAPAPINATTLPTVTENATSDKTMADMLRKFPSTSTTAGYSDAYEIRVYTNAAFMSRAVPYDFARHHCQ